MNPRVRLTTPSPCTSLPIPVWQALSTTNGLLALAPLALYPNPAHGQFVVVVPAELRPTTALQPTALRLYNALGQLVLEQPARRIPASGELTVDVAQLPAGIYTLRLNLVTGLKSCNVVIY